MSTAEKQTTMTLAEYIAWEPLQAEKHEYWNGQVYSQAGGTRHHSLVAANLIGEVRAILKGHPSQAHGSDMRVHILATGYQAYPDLSVVCPPIEGDSDQVISNPILLAEVLSTSTEDFDRGTKFAHYRTIPKLKEYLVVWQDRPRIEQHTKTPDACWLMREIVGIESSISLQSLDGARVKLADIYDKVDFPVA
jgi:Uma2 family endonuclease